LGSFEKTAIQSGDISYSQRANDGIRKGNTTLFWARRRIDAGTGVLQELGTPGPASDNAIERSRKQQRLIGREVMLSKDLVGLNPVDCRERVRGYLVEVFAVLVKIGFC
jgi:hypothetical protein